MRLIIVKSTNEVSEWAALYVIKKIKEFKPTKERLFNLGLPTGGTPLGMYRNLVKYHNEGKVSFKFIRTFNMDEYVNLPASHKQSYKTYMWENFFSKVDIQPENANILNGNAPNLEEECQEYEKKIQKAGGIHLFVGGIGEDGHIAFNEPGSSLVSRTRVKTLAPDTVRANARFFDNDVSKVPTQALTVGVGTVMDAKEVMILATGSNKALAINKSIECGVNHMWTASAFQQHPQTIVICDEAATADLSVKTVNYFKSLEPVHVKLVENIF